MSTPTRRLALFLALAAIPATARPQTTVEQRRPAAPDGLVEIENGAGNIRVIGWDRTEVAVKGTLGHRAGGLTFSGDGRRTHIEVEVEGNPHGVTSDLEIRVPAGSRVQIDSFAASIAVGDVTGAVRAETVNGSITVTGAAKEVDVQSVNGSVDVKSPATRVHAESVNGSVTIQEASGEVDASTVNGRLVVSGRQLHRARLETVSGSLRFEGSLSDRATLDAETVSGSVELVLPASVSADFSASTFSGDIENELGPSARHSSRYTSEKQLSFSTGSGGAKVSVQTLSGAIRLLKREAGAKQGETK
jgi:DUF4097 and DUF4098 domain-containing protein YvlB